MRALLPTLLLAIFIVCGAVSAEPTSTLSTRPNTAKKWIKLEVYDLRELNSSGFAVLLTEVGEPDPEWFLPMVIGQCETVGIARAMDNQPFERPLTYELMGNLIKELGGTLAHIVITELTDGTFYANLHVKKGDDELVIDCRPSDAINLAVRQNAPIFATKSVVKEAKQEFTTSD